MKSLLEYVQIYLHLGNDGSEFAQLQIYQMLIRNMKIRDYAKVVSEKFTEEELEHQIINCIRYMRNNCQLSGSQISQSDDESKSQTESTQKSSVVAPKKNTERNAGKMQYGVSRIIPNGRRDSNSSDSYDESEVNRNRTQHSKKGGPDLFDLIRRRKSENIKPRNEKIIPEIGPADWASQPQETDDRLAEPESLPPLEDVPTKQIPTFEILKTQENSFESNVENAVTEKIETSKSLNNDFTIDFTNSPHPSSSDETDEDSERDEILKKTTSAKTNAKPAASEISTPERSSKVSKIRSILKNSKSKTPEPSKKPGEKPSETVLQVSKSSDLKTPEKDSSNHKNPQKPIQKDRTPSKPAVESLTPKKILDDHLFNTDTADTESETGLRKEINADPVKSPKNEKLKKKKVSGKPKTKESESEKEEESTSSAKLLARTAARKGTHDPTRVTTTVRSKASTGKDQTDSADSDLSSDSEPVKTQWQSLNGPGSKTQAKTKTAVAKLPQTTTQPASTEKKKDFPFTSSSDSSSGELVIDETHNKTKEKKKTSPTKASPAKATTAKAVSQTENKSVSKTKEDSSDSSSSDDEIFKKLKANRSSSKARSANGSTHNARPKSSSSDSDSDQFR